MKNYHYIWLQANPRVTPEQLQRWLKEGFDIHHRDGDHANNDPCNLILLWCADHFLIHNGVRLNRLDRGPPTPRITEFECGCRAVKKIFFCCSGYAFKIKKHKYVSKIRDAVHALPGTKIP